MSKQYIDPVEQARHEMVERHQNAWRKGERLDVTMMPASEVSKPHSFAPDGEGEDEAERAHREMCERNQSAWKKKPWQPGHED